jgi:fumarate reductase iron-sulfur subunit
MSSESKTATLRIKRYRPENSEQTYYQEYAVPYSDDTVVLDALNWIKDNVDGSLTYRWSCRMGVCGSCGALVNGRPRLTCSTFIRDLTGSTISVEPLNNFEQIKDLVVDIDPFLEKLEGVKPWIIRSKEKKVEEGEYLQTPNQVEKYQQFSACINCMLCYSACPVYAVDKHFIGPAASALAYRYNLDSRDEGAALRSEKIMTGSGIYDCTFVGECSGVCPKNVDPALAIQRLKLESALGLMKTIQKWWIPK